VGFTPLLYSGDKEVDVNNQIIFSFPKLFGHSVRWCLRKPRRFVRQPDNLQDNPKLPEQAEKEAAG
jgi:hypothetical protein